MRIINTHSNDWSLFALSADITELRSRLKISNRTDRRVKECVRKSATRCKMMFEGKKHETNRKDSQNKSLILRTKTFTLSEIMTSRHTHTHTQTMPTLPASAVWGIYGPLCALIHTHDAHTHTHTKVHTGVCEAWAEAHGSNSQRNTLLEGLQVTPQWDGVRKTWRTFRTALTSHTLTVFVWAYLIFISQYLCICSVMASVRKKHNFNQVIETNEIKNV